MDKEDILRLQSWYLQSRRDLPWRREPDPYHVWISEIMLQQTRVETVIAYYERFMRRLPTIEALAACPEDELLKLWEGLGYYSRVRNLQKAAQCLVKDHGGRLPDQRSELLKLPGIGEYTAGAIASIAYDRPEPAVDGNVLRIWARYTGEREDILKDTTRKKARDELLEVMPVHGAGDINQAFMDLGSAICLPKDQPDCAACPLLAGCRAAREGTTAEIPVRKKPNQRKISRRTILVVCDGSRIALHRRKKTGLLAGLYELPGLEKEAAEADALKEVEDHGLLPLQITPLPAAKHVFSHIEWHMTGYMIRIAQSDDDHPGSWIMAEREDVEEKYPLPSAFRAYTDLIDVRLGIAPAEKEEE